ncbi:AsmA family protein [Kerstersia gyiorum]|uniref:AsmA family protein n=1 Tax=Kerstersia gyiorum TaxID=206506 RepID=UPI00209FE36C|nr:AsmA family protein [Kerstersia gyiorum]MCP1679254.1 AsmA protein [Kerstersia gyiorum]MCP1823757.1 AsmA protein [Kerstersia gyiorum]MCP1826981.1 AsmA protein [Kerstersia gyiorum]MCW2450864.1 AsmA protein [Kerstersia gyiorum]
MKQWFKRIVIALASLIVIAVVGIAIFLLTFDPNAYKDRLAEAVHERYDRTLTVNGPLGFSLFPRIGLTLREVSLSEPDSDEVFASVESARLAVAVWPLLFNRLVVDHVAIDGFKARVARDAQGNFNFQDLLGDQPANGVAARKLSPEEAVAGGVVAGVQAAGQAVSSADAAAQGRDMQIDIAGLALKDGEILFSDEASGAAVRLYSFDINTGRVTFGQSFNVAWTAKMAGTEPAVAADLSGQAMFKLDPAMRQYAAQRLDMKLAGQLGPMQANNLSLRGSSLAFDGAQRTLDVAGLELIFQGDVNGARPMTGVDTNVQIAKLAAYPASWRMQLERMAVRAKGALAQQPFELAVDAPALDVSPTQATGEPLTGRWRLSGEDAVDISFGLEGLEGTAADMDFSQLKLDAAVRQGSRLVKTQLASPVELRPLQEEVALTALKGDIVITDPALPKGTLAIPVIGSVSGNFAQNSGKANINAVLEGGKFDLGMEYDAQPGQGVKFSLAADTLDLDKLVPGRQAVAEGEPAERKGETDAAAEPQAEAQEGEAQEAAEPAPVAPEPSAWRWLSKTAVKGDIRIGDLVLHGLKAKDVSAQLEAGSGKLQLRDVQAGLYEGKLSGNASLAEETKQARLKLNLNGVALGALLQDVGVQPMISGKADVTLDLTAQGEQPADWLAALGGSARVKVVDGMLDGLDAEQWLADFSEGLKRGVAPAIRRSGITRFSLLDAQATLAKGVASLRRLNFDSTYIKVSQSQQGTVNLVNGSLNLNLLARMQGLRKHSNARQLAILEGVRVPVHITGDWTNPQYAVQFENIVGAAIRGQLQRMIRGL